jgi:GNAT superfamily N-acetyltransferase
MLRAATPADVPVLLAFIKELAVFEREPDAVKATPALLHEALFSDEPRAEALLVEIDGAPQAMVIWYRSFSTWTGRPGFYVEDVYVRPAYRGHGVGQAMFRHLAQRAVAQGCARVEWSVLAWNEPAIKFYEGLGAAPQSDWHRYRLAGEALAELGKS